MDLGRGRLATGSMSSCYCGYEGIGMRRTTIPNIATAAFFFVLAALSVCGFFLTLGDTQCTIESAAPCSYRDMRVSTVSPALMLGFAVLLFGLGVRVIWGMRHGE
jgi:hypothetical protein